MPIAALARLGGVGRRDHTATYASRSTDPGDVARRLHLHVLASIAGTHVLTFGYRYGVLCAALYWKRAGPSGLLEVHVTPWRHQGDEPANLFRGSTIETKMLKMS